jgi:outer membrane protein OmpA-like peptidoglycan-associated protein
MKTRWLQTLALLGVLSGGIPGAHAQDGAVIERFVPSADRVDGFLVTQPARVRDGFSFGILTLTNAAWRPLVVRDAEGEIQSEVVQGTVTQHTLGSIRFADRFELGFDVPVVVFQRGESTAGTAAEGATAGLADIRVVPRIEIWSSAETDGGNGVSLGVAGDVYLPTGDPELLRGGALRGGGRILVDGIVGPWGLGANLGYLAGPATAVFGTRMDDTFGWSGAASWAWTDSLTLRGDIWGSVASVRSELRRGDIPAEGGLGVVWQQGWLVLEGGLSTGIAAGFGTPTARGWFAIGGSMPAPAPAEPIVEIVPPPPVEPPPPVVQCTSENLATYCPEPPAARCAGTTIERYAAACNSDGGCTVLTTPELCPPDATCVELAEGPVCVDEVTSEPQAIVDLSQQRIIINRRVYFDHDQATLQERSHEILNEVADTLLAHPQLTHVVVVGHTDSTGSDAYNDRLSQARAETVVRYLEGRGVASSRLSARGEGESVPVAPNDNADGRAQNRRVEFLIEEAP